MSRRSLQFKREHGRSTVDATRQNILANNSHATGNRPYIATKVDKHGDLITRSFMDRSTVPMDPTKADRIAKTIHASRN